MVDPWRAVPRSDRGTLECRPEWHNDDGEGATVRIRRDRLRKLRLLRGLSQRKLAAAIGCSRSAVSMWETRGTLPSPERLRALSLFFDIPIRELLEDEEEDLSTLRGMRTAAGMRIKDIAATLNVGSPTYCDVETGRQNIPGRWVATLSEAFGVPPEKMISLYLSHGTQRNGGGAEVKNSSTPAASLVALSKLPEE